MTHRSFKRQDFSALAIAALATLFTIALETPETQLNTSMRADPALEGLIDAHAAREAGEWLLDEHSVETRLSFEPEHERLVWRVTAPGEAVVLDAATGEALGFEFD